MFDPQAVAALLTLDEKAALVAGDTVWTTAAVERLEVPALVLTDGPHGVRRLAEDADPGDLYNCRPATAFPTAAAMGSSWDTELLEEIGEALAAESRALGVDVLLGPGLNIKRTPLCGRNFEYFSEDPVLSGHLAAAWVRGLQQSGVGASLKHFAANNQETNRMRVNAEVDERTLREIYLPAFEYAVRNSAPATVMAAYNALNGVPAAQNRWLLTEVLREEWGFDGFVVSDWGAVADPAAAIPAGLDLRMPGTGDRGAAELAALVKEGTLDEADLDRAAERILRVAADLYARRTTGVPAVDHEHHRQLTRRAAAESAVLLTNEEAFLPLDASRGGGLAVLGEFARTPRFQGGGSSHVQPTRLETALEELTRAVDGRRDITFAPGFRLDSSPSPELIDEAVAAAQNADDVVVFLGLPEAAESEGFDRTCLDLPDVQLDLLRAVAAVNPRIAVVLSNGGVVVTHEIEELARSVLELWLGGQASGGAAADVLLGRAEPGGRLAETIPLALSHTPAHINFPGTPERVLYGERLYVGYRWYDKTARDVGHPFGHGLSYTTFAYTDLAVRVPDPRRNAAVVAFTLTNTGQRTGSEVAQVYVTDVEASVDRPERELKAFRKVRLAPGESRRVELSLDERDFAFWDERRRAWTVEPGTFRISAGASSRDLRLTAVVDLSVAPPELPLTLDSAVEEWINRPQARAALRRVLAAVSRPGARDFDNDETGLLLMGSMPLRRMLALGMPDVSPQALADLLAAANGGA
ncbi:glycoside hydrolase family 3 N-terminal domain-containing protein [Streptomyces sp. NPDC048277]|uniref:glycoside hydrolase family 3 N-terminal domain-containing protein n=1 Tax=Streptomyces sp. NPDC048277 TaxID=3155027 RepID=UPI0033FB90A7